MVAAAGLAGCGSGSKTGNNNQTPLSITSVTPAGGATGVAVNTTVTATFNEAMTASSLTASTFTLTSAGGAVTGTVTYSASNNTATFTPLANLAYGTTYTATITTGAVDSTGTALAANDTWTFATGAAPPTVIAETPSAGAAGVGVGSTITATFSEAMQASTITASSFTVTDGSGNSVAGSVSYSTGNNTATFTPSADLAYATMYTAAISSGVMSSAGVGLTTGVQWQFTTAAAPPAPMVTVVTPANGATGVGVSTDLTAVFSEAMNASTINTTTFTLSGGSGGVAGTVAYDTTSMTATFTPSARLASGTTYTATLTTGAASSSGQALAANYSWSFTTAAAPTVTAVTPANGATGVSVNADVTAAFSEPMSAVTLTASSFTLSSPSGSVTGTVTYSSGSNTATFTPSAALASGTVYTATVTTGATNSGGAPLSADYSWSFTTEATSSGMVTVDYGTQEQMIRGFGGSTAWLGQLTQAQANELFSPDTGLGLSILRVRIDPEGSASNSYVTGEWTTEVQNASEAAAANPGALVFATPWTPPPSMKSGSSSQPFWTGTGMNACGTGGAGSEYCGGYLDPSHYGDYANYLNDFIAYFDANSTTPLYAISMQNEPDYADVNFESCYWTPQQMEQWIDAEGSSLGAPLIMPESFQFRLAQAAPSLSDTTAAGDISVIGGHLYGVSPSYQSQYAGKEVWMTEHYLSPSGSNPTMADALDAAEEVHNSMVTGQYNAYVWWWIWDDRNDGINYGLINGSTTSPAPTYYGYAIGQFSKFVQPGYFRYNATATPYSNVYVSAYSGTESGTGITHYVIVAINGNNTPISQPITLNNATVTSMTPWQTTASGGLMQQTAVTVTNGRFTYVLPAQSITTFVQ